MRIGCVRARRSSTTSGHAASRTGTIGVLGRRGSAVALVLVVTVLSVVTLIVALVVLVVSVAVLVLVVLLGRTLPIVLRWCVAILSRGRLALAVASVVGRHDGYGLRKNSKKRWSKAVRHGIRRE